MPRHIPMRRPAMPEPRGFAASGTGSCAAPHNAAPPLFLDCCGDSGGGLAVGKEHGPIGDDATGSCSSSSSSSIRCHSREPSDSSSTRASAIDRDLGGLLQCKAGDLTCDGVGTARVDTNTADSAASRRSSRALRACFLMGVISSLAVCVGLSAFLLYRWEECAYCDRPLRWWLLIQAALQTCQLGLRLVLLAKIRSSGITGEFVDTCLESLAVTPAWKVSKAMSVCNYAWLVLGIVWMLDIEDCSVYPRLSQVTGLVILQSFVRILLMILYFKLVVPDAMLVNSTATDFCNSVAPPSTAVAFVRSVADTPHDAGPLRQQTKID